MRVLLQRAALCACVPVLLVSVSASSSASASSQRTIAITLYGHGKAFWKLDSSRETSRLALDYRWHGALRFAVAVPVLRDPEHRRLSVSSAATLTATWTGRYRSKKGDIVSTCRYRGTRVTAQVTARLAKGRAARTIELRLHPHAPARGFFSNKGRRAVVRCSSGYTQRAPSHFAPSWFFRDNLQDHGRLSSDAAVIVLPSALLPRGSVTVAFPNERGRNDSVALGHLAWSNRAKTAASAR